jgi:hypothetical protein
MKAFRDNRCSGADMFMSEVVAGLSDDTVAALPHRDLVLDRLASRCATIGLVTSPEGRGEAGSARPRLGKRDLELIQLRFKGLNLNTERLKLSVGLAPTGKRRLFTAHATSRHMQCSKKQSNGVSQPGHGA